MSNFDLGDEFIARTQKNLIAIECLKDISCKVYEVTQLLNSMLGLLIFPKERFFEKIQNKRWDMMVKEEWPLPSEDYSHVSDLKQLITNMRNAVAHCNIELIPEHGEIISIEFRDYPWGDNHKEPHWKGVYDVASLRTFIYMLLDHIQSSSRR